MNTTNFEGITLNGNPIAPMLERFRTLRYVLDCLEEEVYFALEDEDNSESYPELSARLDKVQREINALRRQGWVV